jgi:hypothetical protein
MKWPVISQPIQKTKTKGARYKKIHNEALKQKMDASDLT